MTDVNTHVDRPKFSVHVSILQLEIFSNSCFPLTRYNFKNFPNFYDFLGLLITKPFREEGLVLKKNKSTASGCEHWAAAAFTEF